jgi:hypothetical protein
MVWSVLPLWPKVSGSPAIAVLTLFCCALTGCADDVERIRQENATAQAMIKACVDSGGFPVWNRFASEPITCKWGPNPNTSASPAGEAARQQPTK